MVHRMDQEPRRRGPYKATEAHLERAALAYLRRATSSVDNLRVVLMRRVARSARAHGTDAEQGAALVDEVIRRLHRAGLLDDRRYASTRAEALNRRGVSRRGIRARLAAKGVTPEVIERALGALGGDAELAAARRLARRRRLGPYRLPAERGARRQRDLAALCRAGFDADTAAAVIDADGPGAAKDLPW